MPIRKSGNCYKYGKSGKKYCGKGAKKKAHKQAVAIMLSQHKRGKRVK